MVKVNSAIFAVAALSVIATYAAPIESREPLAFDIVQERDFQGLDAREPGLGGLFKGIAKVGGKVLGAITGSSNQQQQRDLEEIEAREPGLFGGIFKAVTSVGSKLFGGGSSNQQKRDLEEIDAREPGLFGGIFKAVTSVGSKIFGGGSNNQKQRRDSEEIDAREPGLGGLFKGIAKVGGKVLGAITGSNNQQQQRDLEEIEAREPVVIGETVRYGSNTHFSPGPKREFTEEFFAREFDLDDLE